jgi:hypothetical protein
MYNLEGVGGDFTERGAVDRNDLSVEHTTDDMKKIA